ncbi:hypothetical protein HAX54_018583 [Datura stramonium]|uniref:CCT domain-containing protein n=1 Tax=Datura stramonium TaxID=4076 RepID=A0ABS8S255_DATST|nr:hypothetical protein [Datura stramonium]
MYGYNNNSHSSSSNYYMYNQFPITTTSQTLVPLVSNLPPPPLAIPSVNNTTTTNIHEFESLKSDFCNNNSSSSCSSYGSPATSYNDPTSLIQRSISSHSLLVKNMEGRFCPLVSSPPPTGFLDPETPSSVRKVLSTGDLQYECRKTLADSRPRIRGRFARNDEIERTPQNEYWNQSRLEELGEEDDDNWIGFLDAFIP